MNFESCGAGMQTTALTLMSCENALHDWPVYPLVPVYDGVFFADLGGYRMDGDKRTRDEDRKAHTMHIGFSAEEAQRIFDNPHPMFINQFPLKEMGWVRADSYRYCLERWGLKTKAGACTVCPFHRNFFFRYLQRHYPADYAAAVAFDELLEQEQANTKIRSKLYISRSRKRLAELTDEDCNDAEYFDSQGKAVWNGF